MPTSAPFLSLIPRRATQVARRLHGLCWTTASQPTVIAGPVNDPPVELAAAQSQTMAAVLPGELFAPWRPGVRGEPGNDGVIWGNRWFRLSVPAANAEQRGRRVLRWSCHGEATVFIDGQAWAGIDPGHPWCDLPDHACELWIDVGTYETAFWCPGHMGGGPTSRGLRFDGAAISLRNQEAWDARADLLSLLSVAERLAAPRRVPRAWEQWGRQYDMDTLPTPLRPLLRGLSDCCDAFDTGGLAAFVPAVASLRANFPAEWWQPSDCIVGHSHLDLVWLWPEDIGERKSHHTWATMLRLLDRHPSFRFMTTSPLHLRALERRDPELYGRVMAQVAAGRWELTGGFALECDTLLPTGEALARCLAYGQREFRRLCDSPSTVAWLPDCFGFCACLPQILAQGGISGFYTSKATWSAVTRFPYDTFVWRHGEAGITTHLRMEGPDRGQVNRQGDIVQESLYSIGLGDGGGGTTEDQIEAVLRSADLVATPRQRFTDAEGFFTRLTSVRDQLPNWDGEIYLELHRGTLTSQAAYKRAYRAAEQAVQAHEAALAVTGGRALGIDDWERLLFGQFHDALPGTSISEVYHRLLPDLLAYGEVHRAAAARLLDRDGDPGVFNHLPVPRTAVVPADLAPAEAARQETNEGPVAAVALDALGGARALPPAVWQVATDRLDNGLASARFANGRLIGLSVEGDDCGLSAPVELMLHIDHPADFDAWDIDQQALALGEPVPMQDLVVVEHGPARAVLAGTVAIGGSSRAELRWILEAGCPWLRLEIDVDWQERHRLLRLAVPTTWRGRHARFGAPFGSVLRDQRYGGDSVLAQWEVPASRWAAVTDDDGAGLALLTEAQWGFSCRDGLLGVSLLRSPTYPDPDCDRGRHLLRLALGRHRSVADGDRLPSAAAAEALFAPVIQQRGPLPTAPVQFIDAGSLVPVWISPCADGENCILRLHEVAGRRGIASIRAREAVPVDLLEQATGPTLTALDGIIHLPYTPDAIIGLRVRP